MMMIRIRLCGMALSALLATAAGAQPPYEFFAMDTAMVKKLGTPLERSDVEMLAALGYRGVAPIASDQAAWEHLTEKLIPLLDEKNGRLRCAQNATVLAPPANQSPSRAKPMKAALGRGSRERVCPKRGCARRPPA
jgi:hypothetical protein